MNREELAAQHAQLVESRREVELGHDEYVELRRRADRVLHPRRATASSSAVTSLEPICRKRARASPPRSLLVFVVERDRRIWLEHMRRCRRSDAAVSTELTIRTRGGVEILGRADESRLQRPARSPTPLLHERRRPPGAAADRERAATRQRGAATDRHERAVARADSDVQGDRFIAILSHELRTPLTPILLATATWKDDATLSNPPPGPRHDPPQHHGGARLIDDLLDLTRITQNKLVVRIDRRRPPRRHRRRRADRCSRTSTRRD